MRFESLLKPVSESEPCGPDLDEVGDNKYLNYVLGADNRMPTRYLDAETGAPTDIKIDLNAETKAIGEFLAKSRDLRLLTLDARFHALAGQIVNFCESVQAIAALLKTYWADVHPRANDGDFTLRLNTIGALEHRTTVIMPLQYAPIVRDRRAGPISLRNHALATGVAVAHEKEANLDINQIVETLRSEDHKAQIDGVYASLAAARAALTSIQSSFDEATNYEYSPSFELLGATLGQLMKFIESARPDLGGGTQEEVVEAEPVAEADADRAPADGVAPVSAKVPARADAVVVADHASAAAALLAAEQYFGRTEPSSPTLILVHQARILVGKPLVAAIEALMPDNAEYATIVVDPTVGFEFNMTKMRAITEDYAATAEEIAAETDAIPEFKAENRQQAVALMTGVAAFFRTVEPSSPIPMVLGRAERFTTQTFQSIIADLMPKKTS